MGLSRNMLRALVVSAFLVVVVVVAVLSWVGGDDEVLIYIDQVPAAAKAVILKEAEKGTVRKIELTTRDGRQAYVAEIIAGSLKIELEVASNGEILRRDEEDYHGDAGRDELVSLDDVPAAVRDAILREARGAELTELEKKRRRGKPIYAAEFMAHGKEVEVWVSEDGTVISREVNQLGGRR